MSSFKQPVLAQPRPLSPSKLQTFGAFSGAGSPGVIPSGRSTANPSGASDQPRSCALQIIPNDFTPRSSAGSTLMPVPGVTHPTDCRGQGLLRRGIVEAMVDGNMC